MDREVHTGGAADGGGQRPHCRPGAVAGAPANRRGR
jgi:hypothetical protein